MDLKRYELGSQITPICRPLSILAKTPISNTPVGRDANLSMRWYEETPVTRNPYIGLTNERDMKDTWF